MFEGSYIIYSFGGLTYRLFATNAPYVRSWDSRGITILSLRKKFTVQRGEKKIFGFYFYFSTLSSPCVYSTIAYKTCKFMFSKCICIRAEGPRSEKQNNNRQTLSTLIRVTLIGFQPPSRVVRGRCRRQRRRRFYGFLMWGKKDNKCIVFHKSTKSPPLERPRKSPPDKRRVSVETS
jgi:hypothetical protein